MAPGCRPAVRGGAELVRAQRRKQLGWALCALSLVLIATGATLGYLNQTGNTEPVLRQLALYLTFAAFPVIGALVSSKEPRNALAWVFSAVGLSIGVAVVATEYAYLGLVRGETIPGATLAAWFDQWLWIPTGLAILTFGLLLFPTGTLPSPRWRWLAWATGAVLSVLAVGGMIEERLEGNGYSVPNPIGIFGIGDVERAFGGVIIVAMACAVLCLGSLVVRYRRSRGEERQQLKIVMFGAGVMVTGTLAADPDLFLVMLLTFLASICLAILKYRLYDIDLIINRTLVYACLTLFLGACYLGLIVVLQQAFTERVTNSPPAVAVSTLAVAALFRPARKRIQAAIDRHFNRRKYDAVQTIELFSARLREDIDLDSLCTHLMDVVEQTMEPARVSLWLRPDAGPREAARGRLAQPAATIP
jgi:hypothetical protein